VPDLGANHQACARERRPARRHEIEAAHLLQRPRRGTHIFEVDLRHDAALLQVPVVADFAQRAFDPVGHSRVRRL